MNVDAADLARMRAVSWHTAWRWLRAIEKMHPHLVHRVGKTMVADLKKIRRYIPAEERVTVAKSEHQRTREVIEGFQRRLDVEVRERLKLKERLDKAERRILALQPRPTI